MDLIPNVFKVDDPHAALKLSRLRRMQRVATLLLCAMLVLLALSAAFQTTFSWLQWVQAFAGAATVGAIADWFAVVALFHHPLGLPFPHTAIVPANKDRIGASLGHFVEHNFLTAENVIRKLEQRNLAKAAAEWIADRSNSEHLAERACALIPALLNALGDEDVRRFVDRTLAPQLRKLDVANIAGNILTVLTAQGRHQAVLDRALHALEGWLVANKDTITAKFSAASKYTPGFLDSYIVNKFAQGIIALLHEVARDPDHEIRRQFDRASAEFIHKLKTSIEYREQGEVLKREFLAHLEREGYYRIVWNDIKQRLDADLACDHSLIRTHIAEALAKLGNGLRDDPNLQIRLNAWLLQAIEALLVRHRHQVSGLITDVVKGWDAREVAEKMELEIGKDLQYIRISGTLVGGTVGLLLHAITGLL
jgi:uncharacterized membrane-anchored protein YjiN (DUF445 family)